MYMCFCWWETCHHFGCKGQTPGGTYRGLLCCDVV